MKAARPNAGPPVGGTVTDTVVRPATTADVDVLARIWHDGWWQAHEGHVPAALYHERTPETFPPRVAERVPATWVAQGADGVLGFVVVVGDELEQLYVAASAQGTGVGAALIAQAEEVIRSAGHPRAWLAVVADNPRARRFYERSGWVDAGLEDYLAQTASGSLHVPSRRYEKAL